MDKTLMIIVHGIGNNTEAEFKEWLQVRRDQIFGLDTGLKSKLQIEGLYWEDVLDVIKTKQPLISNRTAELLKIFGFDQVSKLVSNKKFDAIFDHYINDVAAYTTLNNEKFIVFSALQKLDEILNKHGAKPKNTVLYGHSLGSVLVAHMTRFLAFADSYFKAQLHTGSPLGFRSTTPVIRDFLSIMSDMTRNEEGKAQFGREDVLPLFVHAWYKSKFIIIRNMNDPVTADPQVENPGPDFIGDIIPFTQAFADSEKANLIQKGVVFHDFSEGSLNVRRVFENHDIANYIKQPQFLSELNRFV